MAEDQKRLQVLTEEYQKIQDDLQTSISAREQFESQHQENKAVQKEFTMLASDFNIYKLVGPVLLKQDKNEAVTAVDGRLDFIETEIKRVENKINGLQEVGSLKRQELVGLQQQIQMAQQQAQQAGK